MQALILNAAGEAPRLGELPVPEPGEGELRMRVQACAVCRTDLHVIDGELPGPKLPLVLGHQIVGVVDQVGPAADRFEVGELVGIPWLAWADGDCRFCRTGRENLCLNGRFNGYTVDGGFAEATVAHSAFCLRLPDGYTAEQAAPLLCAGLIGYRAFRAAGDAERLGLYGFGSSAHLIAQVARHEGRRVFAFTRPGDEEGQEFARSLGADWAGGSDEAPPEQLEAAIIFAPVGELVPTALSALDRGGTVVCAGIHMSAIPSFPYELLWEERSIRSVANLTRRDGEEFLALAPRVPVKTEVETFSLARANEAIESMRSGRVRGTAVVTV